MPTRARCLGGLEEAVIMDRVRERGEVTTVRAVFDDVARGKNILRR